MAPGDISAVQTDRGGQVIAARLSVLAELEPHFTGSYASIAPHSRPAVLRYRPAGGVEIEEHTPEAIADVLALRLTELRDKEIERGLCLVGVDYPEAHELAARATDAYEAARNKVTRFIGAASPELFGLESYAELSRPRDLSKVFDTVEYAKWKSLRASR